MDRMGPKRSGSLPLRLYLRTVRYDEEAAEVPDPRAALAWLSDLDRTGRLVAAGERIDPRGHWLLFRASDRAEAQRALRSDPFVLPGQAGALEEWSGVRPGTGVNLEPPPARGSGRLTVLQRISVFVRDHAVSLPWYLDVLGLTIRVQDTATEYYELSLGAGSAALVLVRPRPEWGPVLFEEGRRRIGTATGIAFQTDNVEALALRLAHAGSRLPAGPRPEPWGGRSLQFADPDGNAFVAVDSGRAVPSAPVRPTRRRHRRKDAPEDATALYPGRLSPAPKR